MKRAGLEDPICSLPSLCLWSLFEVKETSSQRKSSPERQVKWGPGPACSSRVHWNWQDKAEARRYTWNVVQRVCCVLLLHSVNGPVTFSRLRNPFISKLWVLQIKKSSLCLELDLQWSQLKCLEHWEIQILVNMCYAMPFFLKGLS